ncbi:FtsX-like permease family protein, partial [Modestobacter versicolor]
EALRESATTGGRLGPLRWVLGLVALAGSVPLLILSATSAGDLGMGLGATVVLALLLAVGLLGPVVAGLVARAVEPLLDRLGAPGRLAAANGRANNRRLASALVPLVMAVAFAGTLLLLQGSLQRATTEQREAALQADTVVTSTGAGLPAELVEEAAGLPGVQAAVGVLPSSVVAGSAGELMSHSAAGLTGDLDDVALALDVGVQDGDLAALRPGTGDGDDGTVALDALFAGSLDASVGDEVQLYAADGAPLQLQVVALYTRGLGVASALLPLETVAPHAPSDRLEQLLVRHDGPVTATGRAALADLVGPGGSLTDRETATVEQRAAGAQDSWLNNVFAAGLAGFAAIAAANTLVMVALSRRREIGLLGMIGATRRQVLRTARLEALVVAGAALGLGAAISWVTLQPAVQGATGSGPYVPLPVAAGIAGGVLVLTLVCTWAPTRLLLRRPRAAAVGTRE